MITFKKSDPTAGLGYAQGRVGSLHYSLSVSIKTDVCIVMFDSPGFYRRMEMSFYDMEATDWFATLAALTTEATDSLKKIRDELHELAKEFKKVPLSNTSDAASLSHKLPGVDYRTDCPGGKCSHCQNAQIYSLIIHLNDKHKWTREAIADWLETLDADLEFK